MSHRSAKKKIFDLRKMQLGLNSLRNGWRIRKKLVVHRPD